MGISVVGSLKINMHPSIGSGGCDMESKPFVFNLYKWLILQCFVIFPIKWAQYKDKYEDVAQKP